MVYLCVHCGFETDELEWFKEHTDAVHSQFKATCLECQNVFTKRGLRNHRDHVHIVEDVERYFCVHCMGRTSYGDLNGLWRHSHSYVHKIPTKDFKCSECSNYFIDDHSLMLHYEECTRLLGAFLANI